MLISELFNLMGSTGNQSQDQNDPINSYMHLGEGGQSYNFDGIFEDMNGLSQASKSLYSALGSFLNEMNII
jgi:hypothetical protein